MRQMCIGKKVPLPKEITDRYVGGQSVSGCGMYGGFHLPVPGSRPFTPRRNAFGDPLFARDRNSEFRIPNSELAYVRPHIRSCCFVRVKHVLQRVVVFALNRVQRTGGEVGDVEEPDFPLAE